MSAQLRSGGREEIPFLILSTCMSLQNHKSKIFNQVVDLIIKQSVCGERFRIETFAPDTVFLVHILISSCSALFI